VSNIINNRYAQFFLAGVVAVCGFVYFTSNTTEDTTASNAEEANVETTEVSATEDQTAETTNAVDQNAETTEPAEAQSADTTEENANTEEATK